MRLIDAEKILSIFRTNFIPLGASISFDSKYRLVLDTDVECISVNQPKNVTNTASARKNKKSERDDAIDGGSGSGSDSGSDSGSGSGSDNDSSSGSDDENKIYTVKITPDVVSYIRSYLRKNEFLDEFDLITEIDLDNYEHTPGTALVFNSDSIVYNTNNQTIEAIGEWEYLPPDNDETKVKSKPSKTKSKSKSKSKSRYADDDSDDSDDDQDDREDDNESRRKYKSKDDDLPVNEIENILKEKFDEYNKSHEFIIHESKNSLLCLKINSVEIVKA